MLKKLFLSPAALVDQRLTMKHERSTSHWFSDLKSENKSDNINYMKSIFSVYISHFQKTFCENDTYN